MSFTYKASWCPGDAKVLIKVFRAAAPKRHFYNLSQADSRSSDSNVSLKDPQSFPGRGSLRLTGRVVSLISAPQGPAYRRIQQAQNRYFPGKLEPKGWWKDPVTIPQLSAGPRTAGNGGSDVRICFCSSVGVLLALDRTIYLHKENGGRSNVLGEKEKEKRLPVESVIWYSRCCNVFSFSQERLGCVETQ